MNAIDHRPHPPAANATRVYLPTGATVDTVELGGASTPPGGFLAVFGRRFGAPVFSGPFAADDERFSEARAQP